MMGRPNGSLLEGKKAEGVDSSQKGKGVGKYWQQEVEERKAQKTFYIGIYMHMYTHKRVYSRGPNY